MMKYPDDYINKVIHGDCLEIMKCMPDKCVDLVLTDPPYGINVGKPIERESIERERERVMSKSVEQSHSVKVGILGASVPKVIGDSMIAESPRNKSLKKL